MTKIDEVARAILKARFYDCEPEMYGNDLDAFFREIDADHIVDAHDEARAAIEANARPSTAMIDAGVAFALNVKLGGDYTWSRYVADLYEHMTRAALSEEGE